MSISIEDEFDEILKNGPIEISDEIEKVPNLLASFMIITLKSSSRWAVLRRFYRVV